MALTLSDQAVWQTVNLAGTTYNAGDILPASSGDAETAQRVILRAGGALRLVEVATTDADLAAAIKAAPESEAATAAGTDVVAGSGT